MDESETLDTLEQRQRKEKKEVQAQIQALKKAAKNDKTKKKELLTEIARLESDLEEKHKKQLESFQNEPAITEEHETEFPLDNTKIKVSKAQRRRNKKELQEKERDEEIKLQVKENVNFPKYIETQAIRTRLKTRNLNIYSIPSDGDCLYKAVMHQLQMKHNKTFTVDNLRNCVASYILKNKDDFMPFLSHPETFEMLTDNEFEEYCDKISNTKVWGGQLEIRALSNYLKCPITVIQATGPEAIEQGTEYSGTPLIITYHRHLYSLGEHYNSTQAITETDQNECI